MCPFNDTYAENILNWTFGKGTLATISKVYIGLCSNDPEAGKGTFNELSGGGYSRVLISQYGQTYPDIMNSADERAITNGSQINWTKFTENKRAKGFGLFTSETLGTPYFYGKLELTAEEEAAGGLLIEAGSVALFDPQTLKIEFPTTDTTASATSE